jgi:hypothetical protein
MMDPRCVAHMLKTAVVYIPRSCHTSKASSETADSVFNAASREAVFPKCHGCSMFGHLGRRNLVTKICELGAN